MNENQIPDPDPSQEFPENKPSGERPGGDDPESTQPGKRLRRLLKSVEDESARLHGLPENAPGGEASVTPGEKEKPEPFAPPHEVKAFEPEPSLDAAEEDLTWGWLNQALPTEETSGMPERAPTPSLQGDLDLPDVGLIPPAPIEITPPSGRPRVDQTLAEAATQTMRDPIHDKQTVPPPPGLGSAVLPRRVNETDLDATRVSPVAYGQQSNYPPQSEYSQPRRPDEPSKPGGRYNGSVPQTIPFPIAPQPKARKKPRGCLVRGLIGFLFLIIVVAVVAGAFIVFQYFNIMRELEAEGRLVDLRSRTSTFETARILDRNGNVLYEIVDPTGGRRTYVPLEKISPYLIAATLATEDKDFYSHPGFDVWAIIRALWANYTSGETVSGASTITQQLARLLLLTDERYDPSIDRKAREIVLAAELTRRYSKDEILEIYLNEISYGNYAYGIEAAAETYFNTTASNLTFGQAAFLAGLPQAPAVWDVYTNHEETMTRFEDVVTLSYQLSQERGCIQVSTGSNNLQKVCVDATTAANAMQEIESYDFEENPIVARYPHWVTYIRTLLEDKYGPQAMYRNGFTVYTTLDPNLQDQAQQIVSQQIQSLADRHVTNGALVAIRPNTGEILAMVGSADFYNADISGQINMALAPRQPGSSIKPLTYVAAFEKGWTPSTLIWDIPSQFTPSGQPTDTGPTYIPVNYDGKFHGPVTVRTALANSYNIPAVKALQFVGIYDDPNTPQADGFINFAKRMGITTLTRSDYGLSLTLGGGDVSLIEMTSAFSAFANGGKRVPPVAITKIVDYQGNLVYQYTPPQGDQVVRPEHAYLITSILSDNEARKPMFGANSVLNLPFAAAAKTGTTNDFRDNWTIGYTPDVVVGVWVGNADYTPMVNTSGVTGAAPIWAQFMQIAEQALTGGNPTPFARPTGIVDRVICSLSGTEPSDWCQNQRSEIYAYDQLPQPKEKDFWNEVMIDTWTGLSASAECADYTDKKFVLNITDGDAIRWIKQDQQGEDWAVGLGFTRPIFFVPERECKATDSRPSLFFAGLSDGQTIDYNPLDIYVLADATTDFKDFRLEYGEGSDPSQWTPLLENQTAPVRQPERIYTWDLSGITASEVTLRLYMTSTHDTYAEKRIHLKLQVPTATPTPTETPTVTPTVTLTPTPTLTVTPTDTVEPATPTETPTVTAVPTETPTPTTP